MRNHAIHSLPGFSYLIQFLSFVASSMLALYWGPSVTAQQIDLSNQTWSAEVIRDYGQPVIPLFDGWFPNADGSNTLCFGYFNMNREQALDIPPGPQNYLSDERFGALLPTHFDPLPPRYRHVFCAFSVTVPADFGRDEKIYWHLTSNGQALKVPGHLMPAYVLDEPRSDGRGDVAPVVTLDQQSAQGRKGIRHPETLTARVGQSVTLSATVEHSADEVWVGWSHHSGPGQINFSKKEYMAPANEMTETQAVFSAPGEYIVRMQTIDDIAAFEFYCCHSNAYFHVSVSNQ